MTLEEFADRLAAEASGIGWTVREDSSLVADRFRGRETSDGAKLPRERTGRWLGDYPVIIAPLELAPDASFAAQVRALHAQVLIARSYVPPKNIVDMHLFLLAHSDRLSKEQLTVIDRLERDESICRKQVCVIQEDVGKSFGLFAERTFLARPWGVEATGRRREFQLDQPAALVKEILISAGLSASAADAWVRIADAYRDGDGGGPGDLVNQLVIEMEAKDV